MTRKLRTTSVALIITIGLLLSSTGLAASEGLKELDAWQLENALAIAQQALKRDPEDNRALWLAARVQNARGNHLEALSIINHVEGLPDYHQSLIQGPAHYTKDSYLLESEHFKIRFRDKDEIVAYYAQEVLEQTYQRIGAQLDFFPAEGSEKIAVEIYPDARGLSRATGLTVRQIETSGTIAVCKYHRLMIISPLATANGYSWADTLAHEFIHLVISKKSRNNVPIWLHEGIAKFYESGWRGEPGLALSPSSEKLLEEAVKDGGLITFEQMHPSMAKLPSQESAALAFAEVFTMIEFLNLRYGKDRLPRLLAHLSRSNSLEASLKSIYGASLPKLEKQWKAYLKTRDYRPTRHTEVKKISLVDQETQQAEDRPIEEINDPEIQKFARLGELLETRGHILAAKREYQRAWEQSGSSYATLNYRYARLLLDDEDPSVAQRVLKAALRRHPEDGDSRLLAGRLSLKREAYRDAEKHYRFVLHQNPFNPEVHQAFAQIASVNQDDDSLKRSKHFFNLASRPRPQRLDKLPTDELGTTGIHLFSHDWARIEIVGVGSFETPRMAIPLTPGVYQIQRTGLPETMQRVAVKAGEIQWVQIPER